MVDYWLECGTVRPPVRHNSSDRPIICGSVRVFPTMAASERMLHDLWCRGRFQQIASADPGSIRSAASAVDKSGQSVLHYAFKRNDMPFLKALLSVPDVSVHHTIGSISTPLMYAIRLAHVDAVRALLSIRTIDVNQSVKGRTAMSTAIYYGQHDCLRLLLSHPRINVNVGYYASEYMPILVAVCYGNHVATQLLVSRSDIQLDVRSFRRADTALHMAVRKRHWACVRSLVASSRLDMGCRNRDGMTALDCAFKAKSVAGVQALLPRVPMEILMESYEHHAFARRVINHEISRRTASGRIREDTVRLLVMVSARGHGNATLRAHTGAFRCSAWRRWLACLCRRPYPCDMEPG